jgi:hypothetical protein
MMSNETKRNVFDEALDDWKQNFIRSLPRDGSFEDWSESLSDYSARYAAALPDDIPVIPKAVGDAIKIHKDYAHSLLDIFGALSIYGVSRTEPSLDYNAWIVHHPDTFARAWVLGAWYVEESGEIVKLEAED